MLDPAARHSKVRCRDVTWHRPFLPERMILGLIKSRPPPLLAAEIMWNRWIEFVDLLSPSKRPVESDKDHCPICLEPCSVGLQEVCENGHAIHSECARKMSFHMKLQCPLCRSNLVCSACKSCKSNIWCNCANMSNKSENFDEAVQRIFRNHLCAFIAMYFLPLNPTSLLVIALLIFSLMLRRIAERQRRCEQIRKWSRNHNNTNVIILLGIVLTSACLIAIAALVVKHYISAFFSSRKSLSPSPASK